MALPEGGSGKKINDVSKYFLAESCSDGTVYNITTAINLSRKPAEKAYIKLVKVNASDLSPLEGVTYGLYSIAATKYQKRKLKKHQINILRF